MSTCKSKNIFLLLDLKNDIPKATNGKLSKNPPVGVKNAWGPPPLVKTGTPKKPTAK